MEIAAGKPARAPASFGQPEGIVEREEWFYFQRAYPLPEVPEGARQRGLKQAALAPAFVRRSVDGFMPATATSTWEELGPIGFTSKVEPTWGTMSGRVRALAIDPTNTSRLFLGTATGGVWRSTDSGATWTPLTDTQDTLAIGAVAIDPQNVNTIYAGTGEGNGSYYSTGILKSTDGGATWATLNPGGIFSRGQIVDIHVSPDLDPNPDVVVVCGKAGGLLFGGGAGGTGVGPIYRSTDGGATFPGPLGPTCYCRELQVDPSNFATMYFSADSCAASTDNGIWKSTDAGATWAHLNSGTDPPPSGAAANSRLAIGISSDGQTLYIGGAVSGTIEIHKSTDGGANWTKLNPTTSGGFGSGEASIYCKNDPSSNDQCGYDNVISVNPNDADDVFFGGVGQFRSTDGGATFTRTGANNDGGGPLHVDHHELTFVPGTSGATTEIYSGNDGGLYKSTDNGANWTGLGATLSTIQAYHVVLHPTDAGILFQGNQDNGTLRRTTSNTTWSERFGGDGAFSAISTADPMTVYVTTAGLGGPFKSADGGENFNINASNGLPNNTTDPRNFIAPIVLDTSNTNPAVDDTLYAGTYRLWRTTDEGANWFVRSLDLTAGDQGANVTNIALAPSNTQVIYAVTSNGLVQRSSDGGQNFTDTTKAPLPGRYATSVAVHPSDPDTAYVTFSGFNDATPGTPGHVFKTTDAGTTWTDVSGAVPPGGGLPDLPMSTIAIRPDVPSEIYAGTDAGVFISTTGGTTWAKMTGGIPNAGIQSLAVNATTKLLVAATHGRSTWKTTLDAAPTCSPDAFEPDANSGQAKAITSGVPKAHSICPVGDDDWSTFTLTAESSVVLETTGASATDDTRMWLRDSGGTEIEFNDDGGTDRYSKIDRLCGVDALAAGTYLVEVDEFEDNSEIPSYTLNLTAAGCGGCSSDLVLANQTLSGAQTLEATSTATLGPNLIVNGTNIVVNAPTVSFVGDVEVGSTFEAGNTTGCP